MDCKPCKGVGWVPKDGDWMKCEPCMGSGQPGIRVPQITDANGRVQKNCTRFFPEKPKPRLSLVRGGEYSGDSS